MTAKKPTGAERSHVFARQDALGHRRRVDARRADEPSELSFDRWLDDQLAALYREILVEPLPDDLVQIVERLERGRTRGDG